MEHGRLIEALTRQGAYCEGRSPLYAEVLKALAEDAAEAPAWVEALQAAWAKRRFAVDWEAAHLLMAGLHYWALRGEAEELAAVYPSCGGRGFDAGGAARAFLRRAPAAFWEQLREATVQTNEVDRSVAWMVAAVSLFGERPFHLVELGTSAGLNLIGDHLPHECRFLAESGQPAAPPPRWARSPHPVITRTGLDLNPRRVAEPADRLWLKACVWADDSARLERLERALEIFLRLAPRAEGPRLVRCAFAQAPEWLAAHRPPVPGEALLVFNSIATVYLDDAAYAALRDGMARTLGAWGGRAAWVEYERPRSAPAAPLELAIHRPAAGGALDTQVIASGGPRPQELRLRRSGELCAA
ncbi:MAG TPA: DUF2332 family protein [Burkholderiales bacterium]|nr:DUF2332 family protein [Burkholderiales bacterium]